MKGPNDFMERLRGETSTIHHQLEQTPLSMAVMSDAVTAEDYAAYLQTMLDIHTGIELTVFPAVGTLVPDLDERSKTQRLMEDLKQLGIASPAAGQTFADARYSENPAFNLGILYVSEGSTLGGKVIMKNILAATKPGINEACRFLDAYGDRTGSRWKTFLTILDGYQAHADERTRSRIIEGARYGFERTASLFQNASATL